MDKLSEAKRAGLNCPILYQPNEIFDPFCLFDFMLNVHGKQLRLCRDGQLLENTVPGQASQRQFTSSK